MQKIQNNLADDFFVWKLLVSVDIYIREAVENIYFTSTQMHAQALEHVDIHMHTHRDRQADTQTDRQASNHLKLTWMMWPMLEKEDGISMLEGKIF